MKPENRKARVCDCGAHGFVGLTKGFVAFISPCRVPEVAPYRWVISSKTYARAWVDGEFRLLHRHLTDAPDDVQVDHRNGDKLDATDANLRICSHAENLRNQYKVRGSVPFKGVTRRHGRWRAELRGFIGNFDCPIEAARAYDRAALEHYGTFAATNEMLGLIPPEPLDLSVASGGPSQRESAI